MSNMSLIRFVYFSLIAIWCSAAISAFSGASSAPIPDNPRLFSGNPVGLADLNGRDIVPPRYSKIKYCGHGIFLMTGIDAKDKYLSSDEKHIFNHDGVELKVAVPNGTEFGEIFWFGEDAENDDGSELLDLPNDTLLLFRQGDKTGLCDKTGDIFLPAARRRLQTPNEGLVLQGEFMPRTNKAAYSILDLKTGKVTPLPIDAWSIRSQPFSEGIASFHSDTERKAIGFIDKSGHIETRKQFFDAQPYCHGFCSVRLNSPNSAPWVIIDRNYKIVSPPEMNVCAFHGDYAVAWQNGVSPPKYGLVDRNFKYVVEPQFGSLIPQFDGSGWIDQRHLQKKMQRDPVFYFATLYGTDDKAGNNKIAVSPHGKVLFTFPPSISHVPPQLVHGVIQYFIEYPAKGVRRIAYFDMNGHEVPDPRKKPTVAGATFSDIAPGMFVKTINTDDGKFDPIYWAKHCFPGGRFKMFGRFLKDYNLIGMSKAEVLALLSYDSSRELTSEGCLTYAMSEPSYCGAGDHLSIKIFFKDDKVYKWCFSKKGMDSAPYLQNVLLPESFRGRAYGAIEPEHMELKADIN